MTEPTLPALAVTGSTGHLGGRVARALADAGVAQRLLARTPSKAPALPGAIVVASSYADDDETRRSLEGVAVLFMVSASESADRLDRHFAFVDAAAAAGVQHVVYTSFFHAAPESTFTLARDHWHTERRIKASGMAWTFLRDNLYLDFLPAMVGADGVIRGPAGDGRVAVVTRADIAACAVAVLASPGEHVGRTYELSGPEALTLDEVAAVLTAHTGRTVGYHRETVPEAYESRRAWEAPDWQYDAWVSTYTAIAAGELADVTGDVEALTGRAPMSLAEHLSR
ncbi:SDR family oxidoreductase [Microbacterium hominis]|uniref:SDR family oxidoreductase n=1 Tax=Microbacterium hominis TaxID=162426 RepID=A0A7D4QGL6_9MICO|nr:SDR family oxidoreductase [Microbacterium hominis]QKJ18376.1 SDR family oxidoreductase [Microbacterium hominis]